MSDTPRTDAVEYDTGLRTAEECATGEDRGPDMVVPADHARTLERELAAERAAREKAEAEIKEDVGVIAVWRRRTEEAEAKVARLREALERAGTMTSYAHEDDSVGQRVCCGVQSFRDHSKSCWLIAALKDTDG